MVLGPGFPHLAASPSSRTSLSPVPGWGQARRAARPHALPSAGMCTCAFVLRQDLSHVATPNCRADGKCSLAVCRGTVECGFGGTVGSLHPGGLRAILETPARAPPTNDVPSSTLGAGNTAIRHVACSPKCSRRGQGWSESIAEMQGALCSTR